MPYSGTVSQTKFDTRRVIENAARRCRVPPQSLTAEHIEVAKDQLFLLLSDLANRGLQLWCIEKQVYPFYEGVAQIPLAASTVDVLNVNLRTIQQATGDEFTTPQDYTVDFGGPTLIGVVGIKWSGASEPLVFERSNDGLVWQAVDTVQPEATVGEWTWFDLPSAVPAQFFRVRVASGILDFERIVLGNTPTEIPMARLNRDDFTNLPNKLFQSIRPLQFWFDRQVPQPLMRLWPVPNAAAELSQVVVWVKRHVMDVGSMTQELEVPQRWYEAVVAMLAARLALEYLEVDPQLIPILDAKAAESLAYAGAEERDNSPVNLLPDIGMYTR
jgi:hypothetical protein